MRKLSWLILKFLLVFSKASEVQENQTRTIPESGIGVIIIGSGPAGVAAAATLFENNVTDNVIILEAEDRIGGRINSVHFGDAIVDLGAEWCHGEEGNAVYQLAAPLNLLENDAHDNSIFVHSSQKSIDQKFARDIWDVVSDIYDNRTNDTTLSKGEDFLQRFNSTISKNYANDSEKIILAHEIADNARLEVLVRDGAFSWFDVAARNDYKKLKGQNLGWKGRGYKTILDILTKNDELKVYEKVIFKKDVVKLSTTRDKPAVECSDNTTYTADHVIWTPSLGVLKHRHKHLFEPALPKEKIAAIKDLGIAAVAKILFYFPERWWADGDEGFVFIWSERDARNAWKDFPYGANIEGRSWLLDIQSLLVNKYNPNVLTAWIGGASVPKIEKFEDDLIINGVMFVLEKFLGNRNLTWPQKLIREKWYSNDHFRGTYSYDTLETHKKGIPHREHLSAPLAANDGKPVVLFAGEASHPIYFSTVHGAIETGRREAHRIINYYTRKNL